MENNNNQKSYLAFRLGKESFASNVSRVLSILEMPVITKIPQTPLYMEGVMSLSEKVLPIINTHIKFGMEPTEISPSACILVLEINSNGETFNIGAIVDSVDEVLEIEPKDIKPVPTLGINYNSKFISGMYKNGQSFTMIIDVDKVFSTEEITELATTTVEPAI
jgi:purine-binding chemotaxis protein CheW